MMDLDDLDRGQLDKIDQYGWVANGIGPGANSSPWLYTSGLHQFGSPELCVVGPPPDVAYDVVAPTANKIRDSKGEYHPEPGRDGDILTGGFDVWWLEVADLHDDEYPLSFAYRYVADPDEVRALQMVLPDPAGRFPWEPGFDVEWGRFQHLLGPAPTTEDEEK